MNQQAGTETHNERQPHSIGQAFKQFPNPNPHEKLDNGSVYANLDLPTKTGSIQTAYRIVCIELPFSTTKTQVGMLRLASAPNIEAFLKRPSTTLGGG